MIVFILALGYLAYNPRWTALPVLAALIAALQFVVFGWVANHHSFDFSRSHVFSRSIDRAVLVNGLIFLTLGSLIVWLRKHFQEDDKNEREMLALIARGGQATPSEKETGGNA